MPDIRRCAKDRSHTSDLVRPASGPQARDGGGLGRPTLRSRKGLTLSRSFQRARLSERPRSVQPARRSQKRESFLSTEERELTCTSVTRETGET